MCLNARCPPQGRKPGLFFSEKEVFSFCEKFGIPTVASVCGGQEFWYLDADSLQSLAKGKYPNGKPREGVVIRPMTETLCRGERLSFKVINLEYKG